MKAPKYRAPQQETKGSLGDLTKVGLTLVVLPAHTLYTYTHTHTLRVIHIYTYVPYTHMLVGHTCTYAHQLYIYTDMYLIHTCM